MQNQQLIFYLHLLMEDLDAGILNPEVHHLTPEIISKTDIEEKITELNSKLSLTLKKVAVDISDIYKPG